MKNNISREELLNRLYAELEDDTCSMSDEQYQKELKHEQKQVDDILKTEILLNGIQLIKVGIDYNYDMKNLCNEIIEQYEMNGVNKIKTLKYYNELYNLCNILNDKDFNCIDKIYSFDDELINDFKDFDYYKDELYFYLDDNECKDIDYDLLSKILEHEIYK